MTESKRLRQQLFSWPETLTDSELASAILGQMVAGGHAEHRAIAMAIRRTCDVATLQPMTEGRLALEIGEAMALLGETDPQWWTVAEAPGMVRVVWPPLVRVLGSPPTAARASSEEAEPYTHWVVPG